MNKNKDKDVEKPKKNKKKLKKPNFLNKYFNIIVIISLVVFLCLIVYGNMGSNKLYRSVQNISSYSQEIKEENQMLKEKISDQNEKLDLMTIQLQDSLQNRISKQQFTEIYMQLQELTGMISEEKKREFYVNRIVNIVSNNNKQLGSDMIYDIAKNIYEVSVQYKFNPFLVCALIKVESDFVVDAISDSYAYGLCQVRRFIAKELAYNIGIQWDGAEKTLFNPEKNIKIGVYYLSRLYDDFEAMELALTAYNHGPFKVQELISQTSEIPNSFTEKVLGYYSQYRGFSIEEIDEIIKQESRE